MKVIGLTSTYPATSLAEADFVIPRLAHIQVGRDGTRKLTVTVA
jgi:hypothetical protein